MESTNHGETGGTGVPGVMPASMSQSLDMPSITQALSPTMTGSMMEPGDSTANNTKRISSHRNQTSQNWFCFEESESTEGRAELAQREREREERLRRMKEVQEEERRKKLEELKQHALQAQKFREQQEAERRRHIEEHRSRDMDRRAQVEERRREIERSEQERREAIIAKNKEREERLESQRRNSRNHIDFAFGSSAPRLVERVDSAYFTRRSTSTTNMHSSMYDRRSVDRDAGSGGAGGSSTTDGMRNKRTSSAQGLDRSNDGDESGGGPFHVSAAASNTAHRRRTDLLPTIVVARDRSHGGASTPGGLSRENSTASRPGSAMSTGGRGAGSVTVRMRSAPSARRPRPLSIATTGMTTSMYEERQKPTVAALRQKPWTPKVDRMKRARSVTSDHSLADKDDDTRSVSSTTSGGGVRPSSAARKTPAQVKAEAAARKSKAPNNKQLPTTPSGGPKPNRQMAAAAATTPSPANSADPLEHGTENGVSKRQHTPDIIKDNSSNSNNNGVKETTPTENPDNDAALAGEDVLEQQPATPAKRVISDEEEAKAKIAEKRREMREKMEREAELERQRLAEEARLEAERLAQEEEEERKLIEETERLAAAARRAEEERIQKAIEEKEAEERRVKEEEERTRREKEEVERRTREEAERREAELQEKLRREEEERLARKKRIEEIMARTRGKNSGAAGGTPNSTPKKEATPTSAGGEEEGTEQQLSQPSQPSSVESVPVDPTTPDLLGHTSVADANHAQLVEAENARNLAVTGASFVNGGLPAPVNSTNNGDASHDEEEGEEGGPKHNGEMEKGALESLEGEKGEDSDSTLSSSAASIKQTLQSSLIDVEESNSKMSVLEVEFDQILDLGDLPDNRGGNENPQHQPLKAFEQTSNTDMMS